MRRKAMIWILAVCMLLTPGMGAFAAEDAAQSDDVAEVVLQPRVQTSHVKYGWHTPSVGPSFVQKQDRWGWEIVRNNNDDCLTLAIRIDDTFLYQETEQPVQIEIDYFDEGYGQFGMRYSKIPDSLTDNPKNTVLTDSGEWKTAVYYLEDAYFGNDLNTFYPEPIDLYVGTILDGVVQTEATVVIGAVRIRKVDWRSPIEVGFRDARYGNNYFPEKGEKVELSFFNKHSGSETATMAYTVKDDLGQVVYEGQDTMTFAGGETKYRDFSQDVTKFGTYTIDVSMLDDAGSPLVTNTLYFSLSQSPMENRNDFFGSGYHTDRQDIPEVTLGLMGETGSGWMRADLRWRECEISKGSYVIPAELQQVIDFAVANNIKILLVLNHGTDLYPNDGKTADPESLEALSNYCEFVSRTLKGKVDHFEFMNEINYKVDAETFFALQKAQYEGVKRGNPDAYFVAFNSIGIDLTMSERVFAMGGLDYMDGYSIHPYQNHAIPEDPDMNARIEPLKELMRKYGEEKPIWMTEIGWITYDHVTQSRTQRQVASYVVRMTTTLQAEKSVDKVLWYEFQQHGVSLTEQECNFGLINTWHGYGDPNPYGAKSGFLTTNTMNKKIGNADVVDYQEFDNCHVVHYRQRDTGKDVMILWTTDPRDDLQLDLGADTGELFDMFGNKICDLSALDGVFSFLLSGEPVYLEGNFPKLEQAQGGISFDRTYSESIVGDHNQFTLTKAAGDALQVTLEPFPGVDVLKNDGFSGNTAQLELVLNDQAQYIDLTKRASDRESNRVPVTVTGSGKTYLAGELQCKAKPPIEAAFGNCEMYGGTYLNWWQGTATIVNNSVEQNISGKMEIVSPEELGTYIGTIPFAAVAPGEQAALRFNFPEMVDKEIIPVTAKITLDNGYTTTISGKMNFAYATYADTKPVIDGVLSEGEWETGIMFTNEAKPLNPYPNFITLWDGPSDLSGQYGMRWDADFCYFFADVTDDVHEQSNLDGSMWMGDSIQIGITDDFGLNMDKTDNPGVAGAGVDYSRFTELTFGLSKEGPIVWRNSSISDRPSVRVPGAEVAITRSGGRTVYEVKIPWEEILSEGGTAEENGLLGISFLLNENDGDGRVGYLEYGAGIGETKDTREFGSIMLIGGVN